MGDTVALGLAVIGEAVTDETIVVVIDDDGDAVAGDVELEAISVPLLAVATHCALFFRTSRFRGASWCAAARGAWCA